MKRCVFSSGLPKKINRLSAGLEAERNITRRLTATCMGFENNQETVMGMKTANFVRRRKSLGAN
jgi:hypothetical protein